MESASIPAPWCPPAPSTASRDIPLRKGRSSRGALVAGPGAGRVLVFESSLELRTAYRLVTHPDVVEVRDQPEPVTYIDACGLERQHTFDYLAVLRDGTRIAVAVKPARRAERIGLRQTLALIAAAMPPTFADQVVLVTERTLGPDETYNSELIHSCRHDDPEADEAVATLARGLHGQAEIGRLVEASGLGGRAFRAVVRAIGAGLLAPVSPGRIDYPTRVRKGDSR